MASTTTAEPSARPRLPSASSLPGATAPAVVVDAVTATRATPVSRPAGDARCCRPAAVVSALPRSSSSSSGSGAAAAARPSSFSPIRVVSSSAPDQAVATNLFRSPARVGPASGPASGPAGVPATNNRATPAARPATVSGKKRRRRNAPQFLRDFVTEEDDEFESPDKGRGGGESRAAETAATAAVVSARKDDGGKPPEPREETTMIVTSGVTATEEAAGGPGGSPETEMSRAPEMSPLRPPAPAALPAAGPAAGPTAISRLYSPIVVGGGPPSDPAAAAADASRRSVARTRGELLSGVDAWFCSRCGGRRVGSLTLPCGGCGRRVEFIPLDPAELRDFVRGQRERDGGRSVSEWHRRAKRMRTTGGEGEGGTAAETATSGDGDRRRPPATPGRAPPPAAPATPGPLVGGDLQTSVLEACESLLSIASPDKRDCAPHHQVTFADGDAAFSFATFDPKSPGLGLLKSPGLGLLKSPGFGLGFDMLRSPGLASLVKSPGLEMTASEHELIMGSPAAPPPPGMADLAGLAAGSGPIAGGGKGKGAPGTRLHPAKRPAATSSAGMEIPGPTFDLDGDGAATSGAGPAAASAALAAAAAAKGLPSQVPTIHVPPRRSGSVDGGKGHDRGASSVGKFLESMASVSLGADKTPGGGRGEGGGDAASKRMMAKAVLVSPRLSASGAASAGGCGEKMATATPVDSGTPPPPVCTTKFDLIKSRSRERAARKRTAAVAAAVAAARQQASFASPGENEEDGDEYVDDAIRDDEDDDWSPSSKGPAAKPAKRSHRKKRPPSGHPAASAGRARGDGTSEPPSAPTKRARGRPRKPESAGPPPPGRAKPSRSPKIPRKSKAPPAHPKRKYLRKGELEDAEALASSTVPQLRGDEESFTLYHPDDDKFINELHTIIRRDIWEGFVVDDQDAPAGGGGQATNDGRLSCYVGTVGFRCRWCRDVDPAQRAEKSAVYPRELERIYHANIRFQRDHVPKCKHIPKDMKERYMHLKNNQGGMSRGRKKYWVTSAMRKGLCDGVDGIVIRNAQQQG